MHTFISPVLLSNSSCNSSFLVPAHITSISTILRSHPTPYSPRSAHTVRPLVMASIQPDLISNWMFALSSSMLYAGAALDDQSYGNVDAPGWVLPLGAFLMIATALAIPLALKPGEEAAAKMFDKDASKSKKEDPQD